jgi:hypothetical protein
MKTKEDESWNQENMKLGLIEGQSYDCFSFEIAQLRGDVIQTNRSNENSANCDIKENEQSHVVQAKQIRFDRTHLSSLKKSLIENYWQMN